MLNPSQPESASADVCTALQIEKLMAEAFGVYHTPRSAPYRAGVRAVLALRLAKTPLPDMPYRVGTAEADAYFAGNDRGHFIVSIQLGLEVGAA